METPSTKIKVNSFEIMHGQSTVDVPKEIIDKFHQKLEKLLIEKGNFNRGNELKITYRFIQFNKGNQFNRWFWGGIGNAGEGSLTIEAVYTDTTDKQLAKFSPKGELTAAFLGAN